MAPLPSREIPVAVKGGLTFATIDAGDYFTCGVTTGGVGYCWGANETWALGTGLTTGPQQCTPGSTPLSCSTSPVPVKAECDVPSPAS